MTRRLGSASLAAALLLTAPAAAAEPLANLLGRLGPPSLASPARVEVRAAVERRAGEMALVVWLDPVAGARLVADPGVTLTGHGTVDVAWAPPARLVAPDTGYLRAPIVLRLPFAGETDRVAATVDYAWCIEARQCLFGTAHVEAAVPSAGS